MTTPAIERRPPYFVEGVKEREAEDDELFAVGCAPLNVLALLTMF